LHPRLTIWPLTTILTEGTGHGEGQEREGRGGREGEEGEEEGAISNLTAKYPHVLFPSFIMVGNEKCGSTTLFSWLKEHPRIFNNTKELFFFDRHKIPERRYAEKFPNCHVVNCTRLVVVEASVNYVWHPSSPANIQRGLPAARLLFLVRNPVERAFSKYRMDRRTRPHLPFLPFSQAVRRDLPLLQSFLRDFERAREREPGKTVWDLQRELYGQGGWDARWRDHQYLANGLYSLLLEPFLRYFPLDKILVVCNRDLNRRPAEAVREVYSFLGIDPPLKRTKFSTRYNVAPFEDGIDNETEEMLKEFYRPYNDEFFALTQKDCQLEKKT